MTLSEKKKLLQQAWTMERIAKAQYFMVQLFLGRGQYDRRQAPTLELARELAPVIKHDNPGVYQNVMIYAVTHDNCTVHVESIR
jgi:hypothetical protein